jgi:hypothetical protein
MDPMWGSFVFVTVISAHDELAFWETDESRRQFVGHRREINRRSRR